MTDQIILVEKDIESMGIAKNSALHSITRISAITEEISASMQEVSESTEERNFNIEEVVRTINELEQIIEEFSNL